MTKDDLERLATTLGGLCILGCLPGSPGERAGLRYGDVLLSVNGCHTPDWWSFIEATKPRRAQMDIRVFRDGAELELSLPLPVEPPTLEPKQLVRAIAASGAMPSVVQVPDDPFAS